MSQDLQVAQSSDAAPAGHAAVAPLDRLFGLAAELRLLSYLTILFQFGLFLIVIYLYDLESRAFLHLGILTFFGWALHYFLPLRYRMPFFVLLSLLAIELVFGFQEETFNAQGLLQGAWLIALGVTMIAVCHLPIAFWTRVAVLLALGAVFAAQRVEILPAPWPQVIWPVLGSMFMFRIIIYLYQIYHDKSPIRYRDSLAYFFMIPNICFPLFPVVDFDTFRRSHYSIEDRFRTYQTGIHWLFRGAFHLLLYRFLYQNFSIDSLEVQSRADLLQYLFWPFLLYLRVSGTFHVITGFLHLFGFNLPETHKLYFLSSSFTDFWRRINIYWKDFIMKIFYYPVYFRLRKLGPVWALVIATFAAFFMTWLLHAYQWFWLRGDWLLTWNDTLFWGFLAVLVAANALYEIRHGRRRRLAGQALSWRDSLVLAGRTIGVFVIISVLWSFWSAHSMQEWLMAWTAVTTSGGEDHIALLILAAIVLAVGLSSIGLNRGKVDRPFSFNRSAAGVLATAAAMIAVSLPAVHTPFGATARTVMADLKSSELNRQDFAELERGYYEALFNAAALSPELWEIYRTRPADWRLLSESEGAIANDGMPFFLLRPSVEFLHKGGNVETNRWGMRDRDYAKVPPADTLRIALVGASFVFGDGVDNAQNFDAVLEDRLNGLAGQSAFERFELLNFGVGGYASIERLAILDQVLSFQPSHLFYFEHEDSGRPAVSKIVRLLMSGQPNDFHFVDDIVRRAGIDAEMIAQASDSYPLVKKLTPFKDEIIAGIYRRFVETCEAQGVVPVWIYLPRPESFSQDGPPELEMRLARDAGFKVLDLSGVYDGHELSSLWIARWDHHPNALGHRLIADKLHRTLIASDDPVLSKLPAPPATTAAASNLQDTGR